MAHLSARALDELAGFARAGRIGEAVPRVRELHAAPRIMLGESANVRWSVEDADRVTLRLTGPATAHTIGVALAGETALPGLPLGRYRIELLASSGQATASRAMWMVVAAPPPVLHTELSSPEFCFGGDPVQLRWRTERAEEVRIEHAGRDTPHPPQGTMDWTPDLPGYHCIKVIALGAGGAVTTVHRLHAVVPPVEIQWRLPKRVCYGGPLLVGWTITGASKATLEIDAISIGPVPTRGSLRIQAVETALRLAILATAHDGAQHRYTKQLAPALFEHLPQSRAMPNIMAPVSLVHTSGRGR